MAKTKITEQQFVTDVINKELELAQTGLHFDTFEELSEWTKLPENEKWFDKYSFTTEEQYEEWKNYFYEHIYDWQPKKTPKYKIDKTFNWFNLDWGLRCNFDTVEE